MVNDSLAVAPAVYVGFRVPPSKDPRGEAVELLGDVIGTGRSSRLYESLVRKQQVAASAFTSNFGLVDGADMLVAGATGKPGGNADSLEAALARDINSFKGEFTQAELDRAKARERFNFVNALQTTGGFGGQADRLAEGWTFYHDANHVNKVLSEIDGVTLAQINALARERLVPTNRVTVVFVPVKKMTPPSAPRME